MFKWEMKQALWDTTWQDKLGQPLCEAILPYLPKVSKNTPFASVISLLGIYPKEVITDMFTDFLKSSPWRYL